MPQSDSPEYVTLARIAGAVDSRVKLEHDAGGEVIAAEFVVIPEWGDKSDRVPVRFRDNLLTFGMNVTPGQKISVTGELHVVQCVRRSGATFQQSWLDVDVIEPNGVRPPMSDTTFRRQPSVY
jgi:hypothetical protein